MPKPLPCPELRSRLLAQADAAHAAYHKAYHKSPRRFFGLRTPQLTALLKACFPKRELLLQDKLPLARELWESEWYEERVAAIWLLERLVAGLGPADLGWLHGMLAGCEGWGETDYLATRVLGPLALAHGHPVYREVRQWSADPLLWVRRAAILIHIQPARKQALAGDYAWPTFEERLVEKEFFIRKAIGWTLRECCKHYPAEVRDFLLRVGDRASGLTFREAARGLPEELRQGLPR